MFGLPITRTVKVSHPHCYKDGSETECFDLENESKIEKIYLESGASKWNIDHVGMLTYLNIKTFIYIQRK